MLNKMVKKSVSYLLMLVLAVNFISCEEVIDIDLRDSQPVLVIQAELGDDRNTQTVYLDRTVPFSASSNSEPVSGASITIRWELDEVGGGGFGTMPNYPAGQEVSYEEVRPGVYQVSNYRGLEGVKYILHISLNGEEYEAASVMPRAVKIDSIGALRSTLFGGDRLVVAVKYQDPIGVENYYRYKLSRNGVPMRTILVRNDKFNDGRMVEQNLFDFDDEFSMNDAIEVQQQSVNKEVFDFFSAILENNPGAAAPANPPSMFGEGTIGYFSAYSADRASVTIIDAE